MRELLDEGEIQTTEMKKVQDDDLLRGRFSFRSRGLIKYSEARSDGVMICNYSSLSK